jgi:voltage-gated potassium channel
VSGLRHRAFVILEEPEPGDRAGRAVRIFLVSLIALNVLAVILDSVASLEAKWAGPLHSFEVASVAVFTVEYLLRVWVAAERAKDGRPVLGRLRYLLTPLAILDLLAILPFYVPLILPFDLRYLRALRMLRMLRIAKLGRYSQALRILRDVLADRRHELLAAGSLLAAVIVMASGLMYGVEHEAQPTVFTSIPATMWWAVATLSTMGIDMRPVTPAGKILASLIAVCGILLFALPAGIISSGFVEKYLEARRSRTCPHCGKSLEEPPASAAQLLAGEKPQSGKKC